MSTEWFRLRDNFDRRLAPGIVCEHWDGDPASLRFVSSDYNIVFRFETGGRGRYLRICHVALHPLPKARQVMGFLRFLAAQGVPVGAPVSAASGDYIVQLAGGYYASAQREAPGSEMTRHVDDIGVYESWGRSLGLLHAASRKFQPDSAIDYEFPTVQQFWRNIAPTIAEASPALQRVYAELSDWMQGLPRHDVGLIHGDYRPGNVIWDGTTARTIDFDEPNVHWYIADVCRALLELWGHPLEARQNFRRAFMRGYLQEHKIDEWWVTQLPYFAQHRAMLMLAWDLQEGGSWQEGMRWALQRVGW